MNRGLSWMACLLILLIPISVRAQSINEVSSNEVFTATAQQPSHQKHDLNHGSCNYDSYRYILIDDGTLFYQEVADCSGSNGVKPEKSYRKLSSCFLDSTLTNCDMAFLPRTDGIARVHLTINDGGITEEGQNQKNFPWAEPQKAKSFLDNIRKNGGWQTNFLCTVTMSEWIPRIKKDGTISPEARKMLEGCASVFQGNCRDQQSRAVTFKYLSDNNAQYSSQMPYDAQDLDKFCNVFLAK